MPETNEARRNRYKTDPEYRERVKARNRKRYEDNKEEMKAKQRERGKTEHTKTMNTARTYGISYEQAKEMRAQDYCSICGCDIEGKNRCVDHCHKTGNVREVLCSNCNIAIGKLKENPDIARAALSYIEKYNEIN